MCDISIISLMYISRSSNLCFEELVLFASKLATIRGFDKDGRLGTPAFHETRYENHNHYDKHVCARISIKTLALFHIQNYIYTLKQNMGLKMFDTTKDRTNCHSYTWLNTLS